jgi:hypothetical protein
VLGMTDDVLPSFGHSLLSVLQFCCVDSVDKVEKDALFGVKEMLGFVATPEIKAAMLTQFLNNCTDELHSHLESLERS